MSPKIITDDDEEEVLITGDSITESSSVSEQQKALSSLGLVSKTSLTSGSHSRIPPPRTKSLLASPEPFSLPLEGSNIPNIPIGTPVVTLKERLSGILRFIGKTNFKEGIWAGIELSVQGSGKNDGSVGGERYFSCAPNTGIFIDARAIRAQRQPIKTPPSRPLSGINSKIPIPAPRLTKTTNAQQRPSSMFASKPQSLSTASNNTKLLFKSDEQQKLHSLKIADFETIDGDTLEYLGSSGANPGLIIQNLLSQLHSSKKQNELLQIRINKKRAQNEATRMLRTELIDKARQEVVSRRIKPLDKEEDIIDIDQKIAQSDREILELKEKIANSPHSFAEPHTSASLVEELHRKNTELVNIRSQLAEVQRSLNSKDDLLTTLKKESTQELGKLSSQTSKQQEELSALNNQIQTLTEANNQLKCKLENNALQPTIDQLTEENKRLCQSLKDVNVIPLSQYNELKEEKEHYLTSVEKLQREKENMLSQILALKASLTHLESGNSSNNNEKEEHSVISRLEDRICQLEDEVIAAKSFSEKLLGGTLTGEDLHSSLSQELQLSNQKIIDLEDLLRDAEDKCQQLEEINNQLMTDTQALEDDNWGLNDLCKEHQDEIDRLVEQRNSLKDRVTQLEKALEVAASTSDTAKQIQDILIECDEKEAMFKANAEGLYRMIDEQDEDIAQMADRENELQNRIQELEQQLNHKNEAPFCHLCCDVGHEPENCPNPSNPDDFDLDRLEESFSELDQNLEFCSECQTTGHNFENCPTIF